MAIFRRKRDEPVDPNDRSPKLGLKYKDLAVLDQLTKLGADLQQPRHALYFSYFPTRQAAEAAAGQAAERGFQAEVRDPVPEYPGQWCLQCDMHGVVLDPPTVRAHGDLFDWLAQQHGGEYDGWEASV